MGGTGQPDPYWKEHQEEWLYRQREQILTKPKRQPRYISMLIVGVAILGAVYGFGYLLTHSNPNDVLWGLVGLSIGMHAS